MAAQEVSSSVRGVYFTFGRGWPPERRTGVPEEGRKSMMMALCASSLKQNDENVYYCFLSGVPAFREKWVTSLAGQAKITLSPMTVRSLLPVRSSGPVVACDGRGLKGSLRKPPAASRGAGIIVSDP